MVVNVVNGIVTGVNVETETSLGGYIAMRAKKISISGCVALVDVRDDDEILVEFDNDANINAFLKSSGMPDDIMNPLIDIQKLTEYISEYSDDQIAVLYKDIELNESGVALQFEAGRYLIDCKLYKYIVVGCESGIASISRVDGSSVVATRKESLPR